MTAFSCNCDKNYYNELKLKNGQFKILNYLITHFFTQRRVVIFNWNIPDKTKSYVINCIFNLFLK